MANRTWNFFRAGGFDQLRITSGTDLVSLDQLDQKLWVALSCPTTGLEFDARTLELIDTQRDNRIRAPELIAACKWMGEVLKNPEDLMQGAGEVSLSAINGGTQEGQKVATAAKTVLVALRKPAATTISVAEAVDAAKAFDSMPFNGDGVVPPESAPDDVTRQLVVDVVACLGGELDRSGKLGLTAAKVEQFFKDVAAHGEWLAKGDDPAVAVLKGDTLASYLAFLPVRAKIDDYFARCRLAAFDERAIAALNREEKEYLALAAKDLTISAVEAAHLPLSRIEADRPLPLTQGLNPGWTEPMAAFAAKVVARLLSDQPDREELSEVEWRELRGRFDAYEKWQAQKAGASVEQLGAARVKALGAAAMRARLDALVAEEKQQEPVAQSLVSVERLVRYHRDLLKLANNFVSFRDFYERKGPAIFQIGTLYLDQRSCELCLRVEDAARHATMAPLSRMLLAYCDCARPATGEKLAMVAAFTAGAADNLMVGRNGVFFDRQGRDWDATITKLVDNPISVRQAFLSPYKKVLRFFEDQVAKRAAAAEAAAHLTVGATEVEKAAAAAKVQKKTFDVGTVAALGVAVGGITAALGAVLEAIFGLGMWMPLGLLGLVLVISGPSMLIAWFKLRQRNLGPLLDANGWALNAPAKLNVPLGASLTKVAVLPPGARRDLADPFAEEPRPLRLWVVLAVLLGLAVAWYLGKLDRFLPHAARSVEVLGSMAPAAPTPPPAR